LFSIISNNYNYIFYTINILNQNYKSIYIPKQSNIKQLYKKKSKYEKTINSKEQFKYKNLNFNQNKSLLHIYIPDRLVEIVECYKPDPSPPLVHDL